MYYAYVLITFFSFFLLKGEENRYFPEGEVVVPSSPADLAGIPTLVSDLKAQEREQYKKSEVADVESMLERVLTSHESDLQNEANSLVQNPELLKKFIEQFPQEAQAHNLLSQEKELSISCTFKKTSLEQVLMTLSKVSSIPIIFNSPSPLISYIHFKNLPFEQALKTILMSVQPRYTVQVEKGIYYVVPLEDTKSKIMYQKKVIPLNHAALHDAGKQKIERVWNALLKQHSAPLSFLLIDDTTKKLFCQAPSSVLEEFSLFLKELDEPISQVLIEARVVIASRDFEESFGLQWSHIYNRRASINHGIEFVGTGPLASISNAPPNPQPLSNLIDWAFNLFPAPTTAAAPTFHLPLIFGGNDLSTKRLNLILNAAENSNELKTILKPSLLTNHGEEAEILVGQNVPIQTEVKETIEGTLRDITTATYKDVGTKLKVKPFVSPDKQTVLLDMYVENSSQQTAANSFPLITTTRSKNKVLLKNGQTTMIGGLIGNTANRNNSAIPFLQKLPLIGWLFRGKYYKKSDSQMLIFITPTIVKK